jgi:AraC-like DNA-binding protein
MGGRGERIAMYGGAHQDMNLRDPFWVDREFEDFQAFSETLENLQISYRTVPQDKNNFRSRIRRRRFDDIIFAEMRVDPCSGLRNIVPNDTGDYLCLTIYQQGQQTFHQAGRTIEILGKSLMVWDANIPSEFSCTKTTEVKTLMIPKSIINNIYGSYSDLVGCYGEYKSNLNKVLYSHTNYIHEFFEEIGRDRRINAIFSIVELMCSCLEPTDIYRNQTRYHAEIIKRSKVWIRSNIGNNISIIDLSKEFGVSSRALQHTFSNIGTTFSAFLKKERLDQAASALRSSHFRNESITEIAFRFGFSDNAHFSRSFRAQFKMSPREYRNNYAR